MTKQQAYAIFVEEFYKDKYNLARARDKDAIKVNVEWGEFTDMLCKNGQITGRQYENWGYPWRCK